MKLPDHVSEIMALDPVTVAEDAVLSEAARLMDEHGIRHLPVVRESTLVGVLSDRDLLEPLGKLVASSREEGELRPPLVRDAMHPAPVTLPPDATLSKAAETLRRWAIGCLPVKRGEALLGFVTETDLLDAFVGSSRYGALEKSEDPAIAERMTASPVTGSGATTLEEAARLMHAGDFRHLPIVDDAGLLVGLLSDRDLRRAAGNGLDPGTQVSALALGAPSTSSPSEALSRAAHRMAHDRIGAQPVVDERGKLLGMLTVADVLAHLACER